MLKHSIAARERWRREVGEVQAASSWKTSGRVGFEGSGGMKGKEGGVWWAVAVWKSTLISDVLVVMIFINGERKQKGVSRRTR